MIRVDAINVRYPGRRELVAENAPHAGVCRDGKLARAGFMAPPDTRALVESLQSVGLVHLDGGMARDMVVDRLRGPMAPCDWIG